MRKDTIDQKHGKIAPFPGDQNLLYLFRLSYRYSNRIKAASTISKNMQQLRVHVYI